MTSLNHSLLAAHLFGEVDSSEAKALAALLTNPQAQAALDEWRATLGALDSWQIDDPEAEEPAVDPGDLAAHFYGEAEPVLAKAAERQLRESRETRREWDLWRETVAVLDAWQVEPAAAPAKPKVIRFAPLVAPLLKVAAMGAVLLSVGFWAGKKSSPAVDTAQLKKDWEASLEQKLAQSAQKQRQEAEALLANSTLEAQKQLVELAARQLETVKALDARNQVLVALLPPEEQKVYFQKRGETEKRPASYTKIQERSERILREIAKKRAERQVDPRTLVSDTKQTQL